ncbi:MAG: cytochrome bd-I oxidase subunit CydX [Candidatus Thiodiazotropha sp.]|jgi:cytochrome bd-I ubiquinol oxidase subunit X
MWYFTWILGVTLALALGIINVMWYDSESSQINQGDSPPD